MIHVTVARPGGQRIIDAIAVDPGSSVATLRVRILEALGCSHCTLLSPLGKRLVDLETIEGTGVKDLCDRYRAPGFNQVALPKYEESIQNSRNEKRNLEWLKKKRVFVCENLKCRTLLF